MALNGTQVRGVLPLFIIKRGILAPIIASCPYASSGAICADDDESARTLLDKATAIAREQGARYLELKSRRPTPCATLVTDTEYSNYFVAIEEPDAMWRNTVKKKTRTSVTRSQKNGLKLVMGHDLLDVFYEVMVVSMRRLGTPVHAKAFYSNILACFGTNANILAAEHQGRLITFSLLLYHKTSLATLARCSLSEYFGLRPNNFLYWEILKYAHSLGATSFDFGRSIAGQGAAAFKEAWGAQPAPLYYEYFLNKDKALPRINQNNPRYRLPRAVWRRLPLGLTRLLGPYLIKGVP
jgi:FemAB-related protein (PEP-CTERM system-associated)